MEALKKAPIPILIIGLFLGWCGWKLSSKQYEGIIENKDVIIDVKKAQIEQYKDARLLTKIVIFDGNGNVLFNVGTENVIDNFEVKKEGQWGRIFVELKTKEYLPYIPYIQTMSDEFQLRWKAERTSDNIIKWRGAYFSYDDEVIPQFKMEIYHKN